MEQFAKLIISSCRYFVNLSDPLTAYINRNYTYCQYPREVIVNLLLGGNNTQQPVAVAAITAGQGMPVASHASMPAQPSRPTALATAAPVKKPTPPPPTTSNPPTPSVSVPTPPPSVTPTNTNSMTASPAVSQPSQQPPTSISSFPNANTPVPTDGTNINQQSDLLQPYNTLGSY